GKRNRSRRASSDRETSSVNSWTDASNVRMRARPLTTTPLATPITVMAPPRSFHRATRAILNASRDAPARTTGDSWRHLLRPPNPGHPRRRSPLHRRRPRTWAGVPHTSTPSGFRGQNHAQARSEGSTTTRDWGCRRVHSLENPPTTNARPHTDRERIGNPRFETVGALGVYGRSLPQFGQNVP